MPSPSTRVSPGLVSSRFAPEYHLADAAAEVLDFCFICFCTVIEEFEINFVDFAFQKRG